MKYFAIIDGEQKGPFDLHELQQAGVTPDTYVWCKEMRDWQKAEEVADICRFFRIRLFDLMHPSSQLPQIQSSAYDSNETDPYNDVPSRFRNFARNSGIDPQALQQLQESIDINKRPESFITLSIIVTIFCFPITGLIAIYSSVMSRKFWEESMRKSQNAANEYSNDEVEHLRQLAHGCSRSAKMWCGISFFLGIILYTLVFKHFF